ncbi:ParB N-terminal domain-containing protein [Candidatus Saccharibacteria bacterium]|nr:ParB N-terminal domain-containing protein [Candidatus Saccharibacteria bacterium]
MATSTKLQVQQLKISELKPSEYNPRKWSEDQLTKLRESIEKFGVVDPLIVNNHESRKNIVIGGNMRLKVLKEMGFKEVPVVFLNLDENQERDLNVRLNKTGGDWDFDLLKEFDEDLLADIGFDSKELDEIFDDEDLEEKNTFDLEKELDKVGIEEINVKKGDIYQLGDSRLMCGDSTIPEDFAKLMGDEKADMCMTDPPYILDYLNAKRGGKPVTGFGSKRNRRYLETDSLPDNFTELWMKNIADHANPDFSIICYENWKNLRTIWSEMEKYWKVKNMIVWHLPNRHQGFAAKYKFFSKHDIAMVGGSGEVPYNTAGEEDPLQEMYETALYAISGKPQWEGYEKGQKYMPTDFIEFNAADEKSSGQGIIFGVKPLEILIPYIKVLTKRGGLVVEPFCGSGSTLIASTKLKRRCFIMEKSPVYAEVAMNRWEKETGLKRKLISRINGDEEVSQSD